MEPADIQAVRDRLVAQVGRVVVGQGQALELLATALLCQGHVLLEGVPGTAKTLLAQAFAAALSLPFKRIQFTPDLMPGDVIGTNVYNFQTSEFLLTRGPVFTSILLADEINRCPPKTQAALLQAMQEREVTIDGRTHPLGAAFMVVGTQNPIEHEGTYPLPEAQLDRFLVKVGVGYPTREEERELVKLHGHRTAMPRLEEFGIEPVADLAWLEAARALVSRLRLADEVVDYVVSLVRATRERPALLCGASPRAGSMLAAAARARAALQGRDFVLPDDVKELFLPVLLHRVVLAPGAELEGTSAEAVLRATLEEVPAPRMIAPTRRAVWLLAAAFPAALLPALVAGGLFRLWLVLFLAVLVALAVDLVLLLPARRLELGVRTPAKIYIGSGAGSGGRIDLDLATRGWPIACAVDVVCDLDRWLEPQPPVRARIVPGGSAALEVALAPLRRGTLEVRSAWLRFSGPLGLLRRTIERLGREVAVLPDVETVRRVALRLFSSRTYLAGLKVERHLGEGSEFDRLREFLPGHDPRAVDWKASARHRRLLAREFRAERSHHVVLAIDAGHRMIEPLDGIPRLDHAINAALLLAFVALRTGDHVGLHAFDERVRAHLEPARGPMAFRRLEMRAAALEYRAVETNFTLGLLDLERRLRRRSLVIVLTDFVDTVTAELMVENLARLGRRHRVLFVSLRDTGLERTVSKEPTSPDDIARAVLARDLSRSREDVLNRLRRLGVHGLDAHPRAVSTELVNRYLDIKRRELV